MKKLIYSIIFCIISLNVFAYEEEIQKTEDKFQGINKAMFAIHKTVDKIILRPVSLTYNHFVPNFIRKGLHNVVLNLSEPVNIVNFGLQGDGEKAGHSMGRFMINSSIGVLGFFDIASEADIPKNYTSFSQTMQKYGVKRGEYLFIPIIGPSSTRALPGSIVDYFLNVQPWIDNGEYIDAFKIIDTNADNLDLIEDIDNISLDEYAVMRSIFIQKEGE